MRKTVRIENRRDYYIDHEPSDPKNHDVMAYEDDNYVRAYIYIEEQKEWFDIIDVEGVEDNSYVKIIYDDNNNKLPEEIENMEYLYRTGIVL